MFAKAAALWSNPALKGGVYLDSTDAGYIHCRYAMLKLSELIRVLQMLENTATQPSSQKTIIPLMNYVVALCQGPLFNVSLALRRRLHLFSQLRLAKLTEVPAANVTAVLELANFLPRVETDTKVFMKKFYDRGLQLQVLEGLLETTQNCLAIYSKRMRHILNERDSYRHTNVRERPITSDESPIEAFISPSEITLALEFAVLITNLQDDTSEVAYRKLTIQVLGKYRDFLNEEAYPPMYNYGLELERLAKTKQENYSLGMARLPFWSHTLHRMFAMLLKIKYLLDISQSVLRQAYMTNRNYLITPIAQMLSSNAYQYRSMLETLDDVCSVDTVLSDTVTQSVEQYLTQGNKFHVTPVQVIDTYKNQVRSSVTYLGDIIRLLDELHDSWQLISESNEDEFTSISEEQLDTMLDEKFQRDRLIYLGEDPDGETNEISDLESERESTHTSTYDSETDYSVVHAKTVSPHGNVGQLVQYLAMQSPSNLLKSASYALHAPTPPHVIAEFSSQRSPKHPNYPIDPEEKVSPRWIKGDKPYYPINQWSATSPRHSLASHSQIRRSNSVQLSTTPTITHNRPMRSHSLQSNSLLNKKLLQNSAKVAMSTYEARGQPSRYYSTPPSTPSDYSPSPSEGSPQSDFSTILRFNVKNQTNRLATLSLDEALIDPSPSDNRPLSSAICSVNSAASDDATLNSSTLLGPTFPHYSAGNGKKGGILKKVRFAGVPPHSPSEDPKPKRRGWYKKPAVLHYPPPPPQSTNKMRQEGFVFRTNLRCAGMQGTNKHRMLDIVKPPGAKNSQKLTTRIRNRLVR